MSANFEFRVWGTEADRLGSAIRRRAHPAGEKAGRDTYLLLPGAPSIGIKARNGRLDVKRRIEVLDGLERWRPLFSDAFPVRSTRDLPGDLSCAAGDRALASIEDLRDALRASFPGARTVCVGKRRELFDLNGCKAEFDRVEISGRTLPSATVEHEDARALKRIFADLARSGWRNAGYPEMLLEIVTGESRGPGD